MLADGGPISRDERKRRLLTVLDVWRGQMTKLEASAVVHFQEQNLERISSLLAEKRRIERRIERVSGFIARYLP